MQLTILEKLLLAIQSKGNAITRATVKKDIITFGINARQKARLEPYVAQFLTQRGLDPKKQDGIWQQIDEIGLHALTLVPWNVARDKRHDTELNIIFEKCGLNNQKDNQRSFRNYVWQQKSPQSFLNDFIDEVEKHQRRFDQTVRTLTLTDPTEIEKLKRLMFFHDISLIDPFTKSISQLAKKGELTAVDLKDRMERLFTDKIVPRTLINSPELASLLTEDSIKDTKPSPASVTEVTENKYSTSKAIAEIKAQLEALEELLQQQQKRKNRQKKEISSKTDTLEELEATVAITEKRYETALEKNKALKATAFQKSISIDHLGLISTENINERAHNGDRKANLSALEFKLTEETLSNLSGSEKQIKVAKDLYKRLSKITETLESLLKENNNRLNQALKLEYEIETLKRRENILSERTTKLETQNAQLEILTANEAQSARKPKYPPISEIQNWAKENLDPSKIIILDKAFKSAAGSEYTNPDLIFESLELLANEYRNQILSGGKSEKTRNALRKTFNRKRKNLKLDVGGSITTASARLKEKYTITVDGEKIFMDQHLAKGNSRDSRYCLRIYFAWHADTKTVIVGHMPDHLPTM